MDVAAAARALNQKAVQRGWYHFCDPALSFKEPVYNELLELWRAKADGRPMPARSQMTPRDLKGHLRNILLFERTSQNPSHYRWRLIGTAITDVAGHQTGKTFEESVPPEHLERWIECCDLILDGGQPLRMLGRVHIQGHEYLNADHLYLPLANDNNVPTFVMGLCRYSPRRYDDEETWENQIASIPGGFL